MSNVNKEMRPRDYLQYDLPVRVVALRGKVGIEPAVVLLRALAQLHLGQVKVDEPQDLIAHIGSVPVKFQPPAAAQSLVQVQVRTDLGQDIGDAAVQDYRVCNGGADGRL